MSSFPKEYLCDKNNVQITSDKMNTCNLLSAKCGGICKQCNSLLFKVKFLMVAIKRYLS